MIVEIKRTWKCMKNVVWKMYKWKIIMIFEKQKENKWIIYFCMTNMIVEIKRTWKCINKTLLTNCKKWLRVQGVHAIFCNLAYFWIVFGALSAPFYKIWKFKIVFDLLFFKVCNINTFEGEKTSNAKYSFSRLSSASVLKLLVWNFIEMLLN